MFSTMGVRSIHIGDDEDGFLKSKNSREFKYKCLLVDSNASVLETNLF